MARFVTDNGANTTVVYCIISRQIEEWRLQMHRREDDFVHGWVVVALTVCGVMPFVFVD